MNMDIKLMPEEEETIETPAEETDKDDDLVEDDDEFEDDDVDEDEEEGDDPSTESAD
jgi:hypothetical protein